MKSQENAIERKMVHIPEDKWKNIQRVLSEVREVIEFHKEVGWVDASKLKDAYEIMEEA